MSAALHLAAGFVGTFCIVGYQLDWLIYLPTSFGYLGAHTSLVFALWYFTPVSPLLPGPAAAPNMHVHQDADNNAGTNNEGLKDRDSADDPEGKSGDAIRVVEQNGNRIGKMEEPVATQGETQLGVMTSDSPARSQLSSNGTYKQPKEGQELA